MSQFPWKELRYQFSPNRNKLDKNINLQMYKLQKVKKKVTLAWMGPIVALNRSTAKVTLSTFV